MGLTGDAVARTLFSTEPRISLFPVWSNPERRSGVSVTPYMLVPGDERVIADRLVAVLTAATRPATMPAAAPAPAAPAADVTGTWRVEIAYAASQSTHTLHLRQRGGEIDGTHQGEFVSRGLTGDIAGREVTLRSHYGEEHGDALTFRFTGAVDGDTMTGTLDMGEYLHAAWRAKRVG
jgi:L-seryl-tRNA(Ser) seleniumtransferase